MIAKDIAASQIIARLIEAAEIGEPLELILVLRGKVRPASGRDSRRWRLRVDGRRVVTFEADAVVAVTPMPQAAGRGRR